jgi:hypothetical protein
MEILSKYKMIFLRTFLRIINLLLCHLLDDLNGDNLIDMRDLSQVALYYGQSNLQADLNRDGIVNLFDLVLVSRYISGY